MSTTRLDQLDLNKLETFFAIAEAGGVSAAAGRLGVTRSAVSHSLAALESSLDIRLFHRVGRRLVLTPQGARLRAAFRDVRGPLVEALDEVTGHGGELRGTVRLGVYLGFSRLRLAEAIHAFTAAHPRARVRVVYGSQAELLERLLAGAVDFTVSLRPAADGSPHARSTRLFEQSLVLAAVPALWRPLATRAALRDLPVVDYYRSEPLIERWSEHCLPGASKASPKVRVWGASTDLVLELALAGVGAAVLPGDLVERHAERLPVLAPERPPLVDTVWVNELRGAPPAAAQASFRDRLRESSGAPA